MATTPVIRTMVNGTRKLSVNITAVYNDADIADAIVINRSDLVGPDGGNVPTYIKVDEVTWAVGSGFDYAVLEFDDGTDEVIDYYQGQGYMDYRPDGGKQMSAAPASAAEGDILLTTSGGAAGDTLSIYLRCTLKK